MKTLLLLRHAKSSWDDPTLDDHDRPLNGRGKQAALRMGLLIRDEKLSPNLIVTSSAKRARMTTKRVVAASGYAGAVDVQPALYLAGLNAYVSVIRASAPEVARLMLVGHNPDLEELAAALTGRTERMPTAALAVIEVDVTSWTEVTLDGRSKLVALWRPRELDAATS